MKTDNQTLARALRILANDIQSPDDIPALTLREGADRIEELAALVSKMERGLTSALAAVAVMRESSKKYRKEHFQKCDLDPTNQEARDGYYYEEGRGRAYSEGMQEMAKALEALKTSKTPTNQI